MALPPLKQKRTKRGRHDPCFRSPEHMAWVRSRFACAVRGCQNVTDRIDPCHIEEDGKTAIGRKPPDDRVCPFCRTHHRELDHELGKKRFEAKYGLDLEDMIRDLQKASPILRKLAQQGEYEYPAAPVLQSA